jgi:Protein of unknown function (DUF2933)
MQHDLAIHEEKHMNFWRTRYAIGFAVMGAIAAYFLLSEHRAHFVGALPFLLLLACPLMHVFMHRRHAHHSVGQSQGRVGQPEPTALSTLPTPKAEERP